MLPDWIALCRLFNVHGVEYLLVGGQAVIVHGYPRLTRDMDPRTLLMLGREPFRIDILTDLPGVTFGEAWSLRIHVTLDEVTVPVIGKAQLITNKRAVARLQDLADAEELEKLDEL